MSYESQRLLSLLKMIKSSHAHIILSSMRFNFFISVGNLGFMAENGTVVTEFILMAPLLWAELQMGLFFVFLVLYLITIGGNLGMIVLIQSDCRLQTSMYFFLSHLSFLDICYSSVIVPQLLETLGTDKMVITFEHCTTQFFFFTLCASTECFLSAVMAYDLYVTMCTPLLYATAMPPQTRLRLVARAYGGAMGQFCDPHWVYLFHLLL